MGMVRVISKRGDDRVQWNEQDAQAGDAEAMAAIREAVKQVERVELFDPQAGQIILVPRVIGG